MQPLEYYVGLHEAECAVIDCIPARPEWIELLSFLSYPLAIGAALSLFVIMGLSARLSMWLNGKGRRNFFRDGVYAGVLVVFVWLFCLPVGYWKKFGLEEHGSRVRIDMSGMPGYEPPTELDRHLSWLKHEAEFIWPLAVLVFVAVPITLVLIRRFPRWYWMLPALAFAAWASVGSIRDHFDTIRPLPDTSLSQDIADIARAAEVDPDRVYTGDTEFTIPNNEAYVAWHESRQIAIIGDPYFNTLFENPRVFSPRYEPVTAAETRAVAAHEIAHLKHNHLIILPLLASFVGLLLCFAIYQLLQRNGIRVGTRSAIPVLALAFGVAFMSTVPIRANIWRVAENQADATALETGRDAHGAALLAVRTSRGGPLDRRTISQLLLNTHPDGLERIERAVAWENENNAAKWRASGLSGQVRRRNASGGFDYFDWPATLRDQ